MVWSSLITSYYSTYHLFFRLTESVFTTIRSTSVPATQPSPQSPGWLSSATDSTTSSTASRSEPLLPTLCTLDSLFLSLCSVRSSRMNWVSKTWFFTKFWWNSVFLCIFSPKILFSLEIRHFLAYQLLSLYHFPGDVAILVASGMSLKQALVYNLLSAITCYIGMSCSYHSFISPYHLQDSSLVLESENSDPRLRNMRLDWLVACSCTFRWLVW